ncbi:phospholipase A1 member A [Apis mellifera carnica]|nr:phospholipase A1 member A [Apis mellifera carnica]
MAVSVVRYLVFVLLVMLVYHYVSAETTFKDLFNSTSCAKPPYECPHPQIEFYLYTRETQKKPLRIDVRKFDSLYYSKFNKSHPTKIIIHGFGGGRNLIPSPDLRKAYFTRGNYNIIIVDYGTLGTRALFVSNTMGPGFLFAMYCSVGLDPTIFFYMNGNRSMDLDETDAHFVDVIHTGAGILGQWGPTGHADFYVNGGSSQPGCATYSLLQTLSCDHTKVTPYYIESITTKVGFWAAPCGNLFSYLIGWCNPKFEEYILMGEDAPHTARGIYYLSTNAHKPYARGLPVKNQRTTNRKRSSSHQY